ncbi:MAG TPA: hypothetical protein VEK57_06605 [Thermoanaerobaculia bacterium]|nr:hypothetical protein [Thermoanaerobaculia bacterium]
MKVHVHFVGICTHRTDKFPLPQGIFAPVIQPPGTEASVVLVNASYGANIAGNPIPPHQAMLIIDPRFIASTPDKVHGTTTVSGGWVLQGVEMEIVNNAQRELTVTPDYYLMPSLTTSADVGALHLDRLTVDDGGAAAVFRTTGGTLDGFQYSDEAVLGRFSIETDGRPKLRITPSWNPDKSTEITLQSAIIGGKELDPVIAISNTGIDDDESFDFLLHYGATTWTPTRMVTPRSDSIDKAIRKAIEKDLMLLGLLPPFINFGVTFGCSNSVYP